MGEELDSSVIMAGKRPFYFIFYNPFLILWLCLALIDLDAVSTVCSGLTSVVALVVVYNSKFVWWLDGFAGIMVAFYTLYSGASTMTDSSVSIIVLFVSVC